MRTGSLAISRGHQLEAAPASRPRLAAVNGDAPLRVVSPVFQPLHDRLAVLERLAQLHERGALSDAEFAAEKALILERHPDAVVLNQPLLPAEARHGPSLLARLLNWRLIPVGVAAGIALSFAAQPQQTTRFFEDALRLFGA